MWFLSWSRRRPHTVFMEELRLQLLRDLANNQADCPLSVFKEMAFIHVRRKDFDTAVSCIERCVMLLLSCRLRLMRVCYLVFAWFVVVMCPALCITLHRRLDWTAGMWTRSPSCCCPVQVSAPLTRPCCARKKSPPSWGHHCPATATATVTPTAACWTPTCPGLDHPAAVCSPTTAC